MVRFGATISGPRSMSKGKGKNQKSMLIGSAGGFYSEDVAHLNLDQSVRGSLRPSANGPVYRVDGGGEQSRCRGKSVLRP
jgi:hypothetical protein